MDELAEWLKQQDARFKHVMWEETEDDLHGYHVVVIADGLDATRPCRQARLETYVQDELLADKAAWGPGVLHLLQEMCNELVEHGDNW